MKLFKTEKYIIITQNKEENKLLTEYLIEKSLGEIEIKITDILTEKTYSKIEIEKGHFDYNEYQEFLDNKYDEELYI